jgi:alpha-N-arabinofuranosidase
MKKVLLSAVLIGCAANLGAQITVQEPIPPAATIEVNAASVGSQPIPRTIFGTFLEPIGNSTYNGLWAEILENPSFESGLWSPPRVAEMLTDRPELARAGRLGLPLPWEPVDGRQGDRYEVERGDAANSWQSLRVIGVPGQPTGIRQRVYLPVHRTRSYVGSFYAKHLEGPTSVTVSLKIRNGAGALASQQIEAADTSWQKYTFSLQVPERALHRLDPADFVVEVSGDERVDLDQFSLMPADALEGLDPDAVAMAREMNTPLIRFGGNFTSSYHWRDGIGPRDLRRSMINIEWGIPEYNTFGTDEFLAFCKLIGAQPQVALNLGSGSPQEAADWVGYVDEHWSTHSGLLWELGNELWNNANLAYPTLDQLAERTAKFSQAVHAVDPTARLIATGEDPDHFAEWNGVQLKNPPGTFNYLSTHFVVSTENTQLARPDSDFQAAAAFALPVELERKLHQAQQQIDAAPGYSGGTHIAFTEWLFTGSPFQTPSFTNLNGAIVTGGFLNMLMRSSDIVPISDMTGIMEFAGIWKKRSQVYGTPAYYVFKLYAHADISRPVAVTGHSGSYSVSHGIVRLPEIDVVPYLDVFAAINENHTVLTLFCVNRSLATDIPADIHLSGFDPGKTVSVHTLSGTSLSEANDEIVPNRITPLDTVETIQSKGWNHIFPHESVTALSIKSSK